MLAPQSPPISSPELPSDEERRLRRKEVAAIAVGSVAAAAMALELAALHNRADLSVLLALLWSVFSIGLTVAAGAAALSLAARVLALPAGGHTSMLWRRTAVAWVFLPVISLWLGRSSLAALAAGAVAAVSVAMALRAVFPAQDEPSPTAYQPAAAFASLHGLPKGNSQPVRAVCIALAAYASAAFAGADHLYCAAFLLMLAIFALIWGWNSVESHATRRLGRHITLRKLGGLAAILMVLALLPPALLTLPGFHSGDTTHGVQIPPPVLAAERGFAYVGIVLWPPRKHVVL